jgi:hexosaminidase
LQSNIHPEIVSKEHLSHADVKHLLDVARRYHVEIVPEIDVPGHMDAILSEHPEFIARQDTYPGAQLDYTKPAARAFVRDILVEALGVFSGRYFHLGADEFTPYYDAAWDYAQERYGNNPEIGGKDVAIAYINELVALVRSHGKVARAWSDVLAPNGIVERLDRELVLENWIDRGTHAAELSQAGFSLLNGNWECTYSKPADVILSDACAPTNFTDGTSVPVEQVRGMKYHVWCDPAEYFCPDEATVSERVRLPLRALAQTTWGSPRLVSNAGELSAVADTLGRSPGFR